MVVIPTTILLTMFASYLMGFTINRVSLFALIFSIGILVDDAIVVIENIARHWAMHDDRTQVKQAAIEAVAEVGNPTVIATLTVVAALDAHAVCLWLDGPLYEPHPGQRFFCDDFLFFVAMILTPWLMIKFGGDGEAHVERPTADRWAHVCQGCQTTFGHAKYQRDFLILVGVATLLSVTLFYFNAVTVKLLPFDNKSEFQIVADLPEGSSVEETDRGAFLGGAKAQRHSGAIVYSVICGNGCAV